MHQRGSIPLDDVPGMGIVMPNGLNMYYLDIAPNSEGVMVICCSLTVKPDSAEWLTHRTAPYDFFRLSDRASGDSKSLDTGASLDPRDRLW